MTEKIGVNDVLSTLNSTINMINYSIQQSNDKNFRDTLITSRNSLENYQWQIYLIAKEKEVMFQQLLQVKQTVNK